MYFFRFATIVNFPLDTWTNYFQCPRKWSGSNGRYYRSALYPLFGRINTYLLRWIQKKYQAGMKPALRRLAEVHTLRPKYFAHWTWTPPTGSRTRTTRAG